MLLAGWLLGKAGVFFGDEVAFCSYIRLHLLVNSNMHVAKLQRSWNAFETFVTGIWTWTIPNWDHDLTWFNNLAIPFSRYSKSECISCVYAMPFEKIRYFLTWFTNPRYLPSVEKVVEELVFAPKREAPKRRAGGCKRPGFLLQPFLSRPGQHQPMKWIHETNKKPRQKNGRNFEHFSFLSQFFGF